MGLVEISKFPGATKEILAVKFVPDTVVCCRLVEALIAQVVIIPVAFEAVMLGLVCASAPYPSRKINKFRISTDLFI